MEKNKKFSKNKIVITGAMVGAALVAPSVVDAVENIVGVDLGMNKASAFVAFNGGLGTEEIPYLISTPEQLNEMRNYLNAHFKLVNDINMSGVAWTPVGSAGTTGNSFAGSLDGDGYTISNLSPSVVNSTQGLFGYVGDSKFKNLTLDKPRIAVSTTSGTRVGALFGQSSRGLTIDNVHVKDAIFTGGHSGADLGGLGGAVSTNFGDISNVTVELDAKTASGTAGGVFGTFGGNASNKSNLLNVSVKGTLSLSTGTKGLYGGVVGTAFNLKMTDIVSNVNVSGYRYVGGVIGQATGEMKNLVLNKVFAYGSVVGPNSNSISTVAGNDVGGIIGSGDAIFRFVYAYNKKVEGNNTKGTVGRLVGKDVIKPDMYGNAFEIMEGNAHSLNVADVISQSEVFVKENYSRFGFDFENIWTMVEGQSAPRLKNQDMDTSFSRTAAEKDKYSFAGGSGTVSNPYLIANADDFRLMTTNTGAHFRLMTNIDFDYVPLQPTGTKYDPFTGSFDGNGFTISNVSISSTSDYVGIFGRAEGAIVKNLTINNATVLTNGDYVGALFGFLNGGNLTNIHLKGDTNVTGVGFVGGMVGSYERPYSKSNQNHSKLRIDNATVSGKKDVGGLMGYAKGGYKTYTAPLSAPAIFDEVFVNAKVVATGNNAGGFSGTSLNIVLKNAIILGSVQGLGFVGGITNSPNGVYSNLSGSTTTFYNYKTHNRFENIIAYNHVKGTTTSSVSVGGGFGEFSSGDIEGVFLYNSSVDVGKAGSISKSWGTDSNNNITALKNVNGLFQYETIPGAASAGFSNGIVDANMVKDKAFYVANSTMDFGGKWTTAANGHPALSFNPKQADHTFTGNQQESSQFAGGTGTAEDPFLISNVTQFDLIATNLKAHFKLVNDIDFDNKIFTQVIGTASSTAFLGTLDGAGYALKNIELYHSKTYQGIFGYIGDSGVVKNLTIKDVYVSTKYASTGVLAGNLIGNVDNVTFENITASITAGGYFGVVAGRHTGNYVAATGVGSVSNVSVKNAKITAPDTVDYLGGLFGTVTAKANVENAYVDAVITGGDRLGLAVGSLAGAGTYKNIMTTGSVKGGAYVGGYAGVISAVSTHEQILVAADFVGNQFLTANYAGGIAGHVSAAAKFTGIYSYVKTVASKDATTTGKIFGKIPTSGSFMPLYVNSLATTVGGHSTSVTTSVTEADISTKSTYNRSSMLFGEESPWDMGEGAIPNLKTSKVGLSLSDSGWVKTALNMDAQKIEAAQAKIDDAFANKNLDTLSLAMLDINEIVSNETAKADLIKQLDEVKKYVDASKAIERVWTTFKTAHYNTAVSSIAGVSNAAWRALLTTELGDIQKTITEQTSLLAKANTLIDAALENKSTESVALAQAAIDAMRESEGKAGAQSRLDDAYSVLETRKVVESQIAIMEQNIASATARQVYSETLSIIKLASAEMDVSIYDQRMVQIYIELQMVEMNSDLFNAASAAVSTLEKTPNAFNLTAAQTKVDALPDGDVKIMLQGRIDAVADSMGVALALDAAMQKAADTMLREDYDKANELFKKLEIASDITKYTTLMGNLIKLIDSAEAVTVAETERTQAFTVPARTQLNATLKTYANWTVLDTRLKAVELEVANQAKVEAATAAVEKSEGSLLTVDVTAAQTLVNGLTTVPAKQTELNERLQVVRSKIAAKEAYDKALAAVVKAETTKTRTDVATAQSLVNLLPVSTERNELQARLDTIMLEILDEEAKLASIDEATKAVVTAETTKTNADINTAQEKVTALPASDIKTSLQERLDKVKADKADADALAEATTAVVTAEGSKTDADIATAQTKVTALKASTEKDALQERINKIKADKADADALAEATKAVVTAEGSKSDADINDAQTKVTALKDSAEKNTLQERIDKIKADKLAEADAKMLDEATKAVVTAEGSKSDADIDDAQTKVTALKDSAEKNTLQERIDKIKADKLIEEDAKVLAEATAAVVKAEGSKTDADINDAQVKVTALKDSAAKDALQERVDKIKADKAEADTLDEATTAVVKAEGSKTDEDIATAQGKVTALKDSPTKDALQDRIDKIKADKLAEADANALTDATAAVVKAEGSKALVDVDAAQEKVTALKDSPAKDALQVRIDKLKAELANAGELEKATQSVDKAEITRTQEDADAAKDLVNKLTTSPEKDALQKRLDDLQVELDVLAGATAAVVKAESTKTDTDIATAQEKVTALKDSTVKDELQERIDKIKADKLAEADAKALDEATKAVVTAEGSKTDTDINDAQAKVTALKDSADKDALQERINVLKANKELADKLAEATASVVKAEGTRTQADIDTAQGKVTALPASDEKNVLQERLDTLKTELNGLNALDEATKLVEKAEGSKSDTDIADAQSKVDALTDGEPKQALQDRLDTIKSDAETAKKLDEATKLVEKAEGSKTDADIADAQSKVDALTDGEPKQALQDRLDKIKSDTETAKKLDEATKLVEKAEVSKTDADIIDAQAKVDVLTASPEKDALQERIDVIKDENDKNVLFQTLMDEVKGINKNILDDVIKPAGFPATRTELASILKRGEALTDADQKAQLKALIDATLALMNLVDKIEGGDKSIETINTLPTSKIKDKYAAEHAEKDALATAETAVKKAEETITLSDLENAEKIVAKLTPSDKKEEFTERLKDVRDKYNEQQLINRAIALVEQAESTNRITDIERAEDVVKQLVNGDVKDGLNKRLEELRKSMTDAELDAATKAVVKAEELKTNVTIGYAKEKVNGLPASTEKTKLLERIATLELSIYNQAQMDRLYGQALDAVVSAENSSVVAYLNTAIKLVGKVSDADPRKQELVDRCNAIILRNQIATVDAELGRLELRPTQSAVEKVQGLIDKLPNTVAEKEVFQTRLDAVKRAIDNENYAKALKDVQYAETAKIESKRASYNSALLTVAVLLDSERKTELEKRLAKVIAEVEAYEKLDGDYKPGDSVLKAAQSIKDAKVKTVVLAWAKAVEDAEYYNSSALVNALIKVEKEVPQEILNNPKYKDLIEELVLRTAHIKESNRVFGSLVARGAIKKAYIAVLEFERDQTDAKKKAAKEMIDGLKRFASHEQQVEKLFVRIERIKIETK